MTRDEITRITIEHRGQPGGWSITMFVEPVMCKEARQLHHAELVGTAENILREAKSLDGRWKADNAEVMAWSSAHAESPAEDWPGINVPHRYRVTLDMVREYDYYDSCDTVEAEARP